MYKLLFILLILSQQALGQLTESMRVFVDNSANESASISFCVLDLDSNKVIFEYESSKKLITASTMKLWSTAYALETLGPNFRPITKLFIDGSVDSLGVLKGNLVVQGGGDPALGSRYFGEAEDVRFLDDWVGAVKKLGIRQITGSVHIDGSKLPYDNMVDGWTWGDIGNYYGAQATGIMLCDNTSFLHFRTSTPGNNTQLIRHFPPIADFSFQNEIISGKHRSDKSMIYGAPYASFRYGSGSLPANRADYVVKASLPDPEASLGVLLVEKLNAAGIEVKEHTTHRSSPHPYLAANPIHTQYGPNIHKIASLTNEKSINIFAEQLVGLSWMVSDQSTNDIYQPYQEFWEKRIPNFNSKLHDGSGLARTNAISARQFCDMLYYVSQRSYSDKFESTLPVAGESGTVKSLCKGGSGSGKIRCKSGTMNAVKSYAGYATSKSGRNLAFAIIVNQHDFESNASITREISKVLNALILTY